MAMSKSEQEVICNVIKRLRCTPRDSGNHREAKEVRNALRSYYARLYLDAWVIGALECLLDSDECPRNIKLALLLSE